MEFALPYLGLCGPLSSFQFLLLEWEYLSYSPPITAFWKHLICQVLQGHNWRGILLRMNWTLSLTHIWLKRYLDETLAPDFRVDVETSSDLGATGMAWMCFEGEGINLGFGQEHILWTGLCPLPNSYVEALLPSMTVFRNRALRRQLMLNGVIRVAFWEETAESLLALSVHVHLGKAM